MARHRETAVRQPLLDRLVDDEPQLAEDAGLTWSESVDAYKRAVLRDLEWLLNTRRTVELPPDDFPETRESLYCYGLPDISSMSSDDPDVHRRLQRHLDQLVRTFEPRLASVRVTLSEDDEKEAKRVRFSVEGLLRMDPEPERVEFDTVLEIASGRFVVSGD